MTMKWELYEDGYNRRQRLVRFPEGLIVGGVSGSNFDSQGWYAHTDGAEGVKRVGYFVTEDLAKEAVENANS
jgi:hypothetical protein